MKKNKLAIGIVAAWLLFSVLNHWKDVKQGFTDAINGDNTVASIK